MTYPTAVVLSARTIQQIRHPAPFDTGEPTWPQALISLTQQ
jgi:hypothetical protein